MCKHWVLEAQYGGVKSTKGHPLGFLLTGNVECGRVRVEPGDFLDAQHGLGFDADIDGRSLLDVLNCLEQN